MPENIVLPDDSTRPEPPVIDDLTEVELESGRHLAAVHDGQRRNMQVLRDLISAARAGSLSTSELAEATESLPLLKNYRHFGSLCGQHCQIVHTHHSIEDAYLFPELSAKAEAFRRVVNRLMEEHEVVHALLLELIDELNTLIESPSNEAFETAVTTYDRLETLLLSHFTYEERAIGPALGRYGVEV